MLKKGRFLLILGLLPILFLLKKGCQNQTDADWTDVNKLLQTQFFTLANAKDSIKMMHNRFHGGSMNDSIGWKILSTPTLPTMTFEKFNHIFQQITTQRFAVISAVSGVGLTTLCDRLARLIATRPENFLQISCAPEFDLEYHKKYIGETFIERGKKTPFQTGILIQFWQRAAANPTEKFVFLMDNLDKINPETFFGPELWEKLNDPKHPVKLGGQVIEIPKNFYLISTTHLGGGAKIELSNEHFKRIGNQIVLEPTAEELVIYLQEKLEELQISQIKNGKLNSLDAQKLAALTDTNQLQRFVYFFKKSNIIVDEQLDPSFQMGWTSIRNFYLPTKFQAFRDIFINNVNGLKPRESFSNKNLASVDYALKTGGLLNNSNFFARQIDWMRELGFLTEFTVIGLTALFTGVGGWWLFRKNKKQLIELRIEVAETMQLFDNQQITSEIAWKKLVDIKQNLHEKVVARELSYPEGLYFLRQLDDETRRLEISKQTNEMFLQLVETFLDDNVLTEGEYRKLIQFLDSIRSKITASDWQRYRDEVDFIYQKFKNLP
jgi:hypothetical protein